MRNWIWFSTLWLLPKNSLSRLMGRIVSVQLPPRLNRLLLQWFVKRYNINVAEAKKPLHAYASVQELFTRELAANARVIAPEADAFVSPCDGAWGESGVVQDGLVFQVKGRPYRLDTLLGDSALAKSFEGGDFATLYLSPKDYHRFHAPCWLQVTRARYLPGYLWPVNEMAINNVDNLFCVNERIVALCETGRDKDEFAIIAVGATMVGKVHMHFDPTLTTNDPRGHGILRDYHPSETEFTKGQEFGYFAFGSTIVVVAKKGILELQFQPKGVLVQMGQSIGKFLLRPKS